MAQRYYEVCLYECKEHDYRACHLGSQDDRLTTIVWHNVRNVGLRVSGVQGRTVLNSGIRDLL